MSASGTTCRELGLVQSTRRHHLIVFASNRHKNTLTATKTGTTMLYAHNGCDGDLNKPSIRSLFAGLKVRYGGEKGRAPDALTSVGNNMWIYLTLKEHFWHQYWPRYSTIRSRPSVRFSLAFEGEASNCLVSIYRSGASFLRGLLLVELLWWPKIRFG